MTIPRFVPITVDGVVLRPVVAADAESLLARRNDPTTAEFQAWEFPYPLEKARALIDEMLVCDGVPPADGWFQIGVDDADTGAPLGDLALRLGFGGRIAEIGYTLAPDARGRGVATSAAGALARWLFETVGVSRVGAQMHPDNTASIRVAEKIGMVHEGRTRNSYWVGDVNSDDVHYGMTPESWREWCDRPRHAPADVRLVEITSANARAVRTIVTHHSQRNFVSPVLDSFAEALFPADHEGHRIVPWLRAIEADGELVGFVMMAERSEHHPRPYLWRFLVDRLHQRRGIGARALDLTIAHAREQGADAMELSYVEAPGSPEALYRSRGFEPTGDVEDGETLARLHL